MTAITVCLVEGNVLRRRRDQPADGAVQIALYCVAVTQTLVGSCGWLSTFSPENVEPQRGPYRSDQLHLASHKPRTGVKDYGPL